MDFQNYFQIVSQHNLSNIWIYLNNKMKSNKEIYPNKQI